jgi:hypothetical protein
MSTAPVEETEDGAESAAEDGGENTEQHVSEPSPPPKEATIRIGNLDVPTKEIAPHFDPACPRRCVSGVRKVGRPFRGKVVYLSELCDCAVIGWLKARPTVEPPIVAGSLAQAAATKGSIPDAGNPRGEQVRRLRARRAMLEEEHTAVLAEIDRRVAPISAELACEEAAAAAAESIVEETDRAAREIASEIIILEARAHAAAVQGATARAAALGAQARAAVVRARASAIRSVRGKDERGLARQIERIDRRIERIALYHPGAVDG